MKTSAERVREFRRKAKEAGKVEAQGIWVYKDLREHLKDYVKFLNKEYEIKNNIRV